MLPMEEMSMATRVSLERRVEILFAYHVDNDTVIVFMKVTSEIL